MRARARVRMRGGRISRHGRSLASMVRLRLTAAVLGIGLLGVWCGYMNHPQRRNEQRQQPDQVIWGGSFPPIAMRPRSASDDQNQVLDDNRLQREYSVARTTVASDQPRLVQPASTRDRNSGAAAPLRRPVPHILHQSWKTAAIPAVWAPFIQSWVKLHSDWEYRFYSDDGLRRFFSRELPEFLEAFNSCDPICKADLSRLGFMLVFGGVYADMDFEALKKFDTLVDASALHEAFLAKVGC